MKLKPIPSRLTPKELKVLTYIKTYSAKKGYAPTYAEIQGHFNYSAVGSVQQFIKQLVAKGCLDVPLGENQKRAISIARPLVSEPLSPTAAAMQSIPLEGYVAAGRLTEAVRYSESVAVPREMMKGDADYFALKIKGDSMIEDCIMDGDLVIIRKQNDATNGQTVVALVDDEATIKRYYKKSEYVELRPANPNFSVIQVEPNKDFKILGVLAGVIRHCG